MLASIGSPVPVVGFLAHDPAGAQGLWAGVMTRRFAGSDLVRSTRAIAESVLTSWPALIPAATPDAGAGGSWPARARLASRNQRRRPWKAVRS